MNLMDHTDISWAKVRQYLANVLVLRGATKQKSRSKPRKAGVPISACGSSSACPLPSWAVTVRGTAEHSRFSRLAEEYAVPYLLLFQHCTLPSTH